jgi:hypothetical protein
MDSRLIWKAGKGSLALLQKTHVLSGENQARVVAIDPGVRPWQPFMLMMLLTILARVVILVFKGAHIAKRCVIF